MKHQLRSAVCTEVLSVLKAEEWLEHALFG